MNLNEIQPKTRVAYVPTHAHGDLNHPDVEHGTVSSKNDHFAFVKFDKQLARFGWEGTTSQSCRPDDLVPEPKASPAPKASLPEAPRACNNGFWDLDPGERGARMDAACERGGVSNFFDLSPEERGTAYGDER